MQYNIILTVLAALASAMPQIGRLISATPDSTAEIQSRQQTNPICREGLPKSASAYEISQRIADLKQRTGDCGLQPGQCQVLECAYNSGIKWCNNNDHFASWKCRDFWPHAQGILNECSYNGVIDSSTAVWGREPDVQGFEVQVGFIPC